MNGLLTVQSLFGGRRFDDPGLSARVCLGRAAVERPCSTILRRLPATKDHFTGTVVLKARELDGQLVDIEGQQYRAYDVVDGQQRLTTLVLLLEAIRRELHRRSA